MKFDFTYFLLRVLRYYYYYCCCCCCIFHGISHIQLTINIYGGPWYSGKIRSSSWSAKVCPGLFYTIKYYIFKESLALCREKQNAKCKYCNDTMISKVSAVLLLVNFTKAYISCPSLCLKVYHMPDLLSSLFKEISMPNLRQTGICLLELHENKFY
jgi:hypothetical protein